MSAVGPSLPIQYVRALVVIGCKADLPLMDRMGGTSRPQPLIVLHRCLAPASRRAKDSAVFRSVLKLFCIRFKNMICRARRRYERDVLRGMNRPGFAGGRLV